MFTGLIQEIGRVERAEPSGDGARIEVATSLVGEGAREGDSIAVSGVCLTVAERGPGWLVADVMRQTLDLTTLGGLVPGDAVNLEPALRASDRLGGHIVQGHVDGRGEVVKARPGERWRVLRIAIPAESAPLVAAQGSIAVDGVSLTVSAVADPEEAPSWFEVALIPETLERTTLGALAERANVNIETDVLARHVRRLIAFTEGSRL